MAATLPRWTMLQLWRELGQQFRVDSVRCAAAAKSGHPTSCMSAADLMAVLLAKYLRYDFDDPKRPTNDRLDLLEGPRLARCSTRCSRRPARSPTRSCSTYRQFGSCSRATRRRSSRGSTSRPARSGQGLPIGVGMALAGKYLDRLPYRVWVLCGDSEMAEGSIWEAFEHASHYELDNLIAILDVNRLGQRGETMLGWDLDSYATRAPGVRLARDRDRRARRRGDRRGLRRGARRRPGSRPSIVARR